MVVVWAWLWMVSSVAMMVTCWGWFQLLGVKVSSSSRTLMVVGSLLVGVTVTSLLGGASRTMV